MFHLQRSVLAKMSPFLPSRYSLPRSLARFRNFNSIRTLLGITIIPSLLLSPNGSRYQFSDYPNYMTTFERRLTSTLAIPRLAFFKFFPFDTVYPTLCLSQARVFKIRNDSFMSPHGRENLEQGRDFEGSKECVSSYKERRCQRQPKKYRSVVLFILTLSMTYRTFPPAKIGPGTMYERCRREMHQA